MRDALDGYIQSVRGHADHVKGSEQWTKQSLIGPLFTLLGYDMANPRQVKMEYRCDFGKGRSRLPIDWAFMRDGTPLFFVEAKAAGKKLTGYDEQLGDYFGKSPETRLGILTNGVMWRFFTDLDHIHKMDLEPFERWDVLNDEDPPIQLLTLLRHPEFNPDRLRDYAEHRRRQSQLVPELMRILAPSTEFTKLAISKLETRKPLMPVVVESWKADVREALKLALRALKDTPAPPAADETRAASRRDAARKAVATRQARMAAAQGGPAASPASGSRDPRLPPPGTVLQGKAKGKKVRATVLEDGGFLCQGKRYKSLSAIANRVGGVHQNGYVFFGLGLRK